MTTVHRYLVRAAAVFALMGASTLWTAAQNEPAQSAEYAILIVGDESNAEVLRREKVLIQEIAKVLKKSPRLPIFSYHFNKERERTYCEKKLNVLREDLLFIGIVSLKDRVPREVIYRVDRIVTPSRAAQDVVARGEALTAVPTETPSLTPSPSASPTTTPSPGQTGGRFRVQLGVFTQQKFAQDLVDQLKGKAYDARIETLEADGRETYRVWVGTFSTKEDAQQALTELQSDGFDKGFVVEAR